MSDNSKSVQPEHSHHGFLAGLFVGGFVGAILIAFMGTDKGKKLADQFREEGSDMFEDYKQKLEEKKSELAGASHYAVDKSQELLDHAQALSQKLEEKVKQKKETVQTVTDQAQSRLVTQVVDSADTSLSHIEKMQKRARETVESTRQKFKNIPKK